MDVETLVFNSHNVRAIFRTPEEIQRIAKTLLDPGLIHHPVGSLLPDGQILVCAGEKRSLGYQSLKHQGMQEFSQIDLKMMEGLSEETAMRILSVENMEHGTRIPAATANEVYWHFRVEYISKISINRAIEAVMRIWKREEYVYNALVVTGWLIYYSPTVRRIMEKIGPHRENLNDPWVQETADKIRRVRLGWWDALGLVFRPLRKDAVIRPPEDADRLLFDELMHRVFDEVLARPRLRGAAAEAHILDMVLSLRKERMEKILNEKEGHPDEERRAARKEFKLVEKMIKKHELLESEDDPDEENGEDGL